MPYNYALFLGSLLLLDHSSNIFFIFFIFFGSNKFSDVLDLKAAKNLVNLPDKETHLNKFVLPKRNSLPEEFLA